LKSFNAILLCSALCLFSLIQAQCDKVLIRGRVIDSLRPQSFYNIMVVNRSSGKASFGQPNGSFSVYGLANERIALSVKQYPIYEFIVTPDSNCQCQVLAYIDRLPQEVAEVVVKPLKTLEQIKEERAALAMVDTRMVSGKANF